MTNTTSRPVFQSLITMYECCALNSTGTLLIILMHATIQFIYCHYMNDQSTSYGAKDKCSSIQQICVDSDYLSCEIHH